MRVIGLIGGMSWESTSLYYQQLNRGVQKALGGQSSAKVILHSVNFAEIEALQHQGDWQTAGKILNQAALGLAAAGADCIVIATNTMHCVAEAVMAGVELPLLHIAEPTARAVKSAGIDRIALLGTAFTMEQRFYRQVLEEAGLEVLVPDEQERTQVHQIIYQELCQGKVDPQSRALYQQIIQRLSERGAQGVILGCTEITLLIKPEHSSLPVFDTTALHVQACLDFSLS